MLSVTEAFEQFRSRLEITETEQRSASRRQRKIREILDDEMDIDRDFLTGAYARSTKTKPLADVDIFIVLGRGESAYRDEHPSAVLERVRSVLAPQYGDHRVTIDRRAVRVDFGLQQVDDVTEDVVSFDVVPAFAIGSNFEIPDEILGVWITTNPDVHAELATAANKAFDLKWKPVVKMLKQWNRHHDGPIEPSFLVEVLALDLLVAPWGGSYPYEARQFFASAADRLSEGWADPANVGPPVSDVLDENPAKMLAGIAALKSAEALCTEALRLERDGRVGDALRTWRNLFGSAFVVS